MINKLLKYLLLSAVYCFLPVTILGFKLAEYTFNLMVLISIILLFIDNDLELHVHKNEKILFIIYALFNFVAFLSIIYGYSSRSYNLREELVYVAIIPCYFIIRKIGVNLGKIIWLSSIASILNMMFAVYQFFSLHVVNEATGMMSGARVYFGVLSVILGVMPLLLLRIIQHDLKSKPILIITYVAFCAGVVSTLMSGSRGALIGFLVLFILSIIYYKDLFSSLKYKIALLLFIAFVVFVGIATNQYERFYMIYANLSNCGVHNDISTNSLCLRLNVWGEAWYIFYNHPLLGIGINSWHVFIANPNNIVVNKGIMELFHAHSDFMRILALMGGIGFVLFLGMLVMPFIIFSEANKELKFAVYGFHIIFIIFMLTDCLLVNRLFASLYAFYMIVFLSVNYKNRY